VTPSYKPGVHLTDLRECLPDYVIDSIREALPVFGRQVPGYDHPDVIMTGVETRTSSPLRITRGRICSPSIRAGCTRRVKVLAMLAGFCRRRWMGFGWRKPWRRNC
jgi:hypothetical protein